jgi:hypothetical protein
MAIGTVTQTQTTAFFLGERFGALESRYTALRVLDEDDEFLIRGSNWFAETKRLVERRDALMHRPVQADFAEGSVLV